jgi:YHS domain-containing protein
MLAATLIAADEVKLEGIKCIMNPKATVKADASTDYKGAKVYFCCGDCCGKFVKESEKHAVKANHQLVATKQAKQEKCPLSGAPCKPEHKVTVGGPDVLFCCPNCQSKVAKAEGDAQAELVFSDKAFEKAFRVVKKEKTE